MSAEQKQAYQQLVKKRAETLRKTATDRAKKYALIFVTGYHVNMMFD